MEYLFILGTLVDTEKKNRELQQRNHIHKRQTPQQNNVEVMAVIDHAIYNR